MSHVTVVKTVVRDLTALEDACRDLGVELVRGQTTYGWYGRSVGDFNAANEATRMGVPVDQLGKCEHAVKVPDSVYEVGVVRLGGDYRLVFDGWGPGERIVETLGSDLKRLGQAYTIRAAQAAMKTCENKGFRPVQVVGRVGEPMQLVYQRG